MWLVVGPLNLPPCVLSLANLCLGFSGIFGYISYLVEKDRKYILDTLVNGNKNDKSHKRCLGCSQLKVSRVWSIEAMTPQVWP